jgi:hypothetical protein
MIATGKAGIVEKRGSLGITADGGLAIKLVNKTGAQSVKGYIAGPSAGTDFAFDMVGDDEPNLIGIVFGDEDGSQVADGADCWVVVQGCAYVYCMAAATRGDFVRSQVAADGGTVGMAVAEANPTSPFSTDKHFQEVGHCIESTGGAGLALCVVHLN